MKSQTVLTHLSGAIITYLIVASCSTHGDAPSGSFTLDGSVGPAGPEAGAFLADGASASSSGAGNAGGASWLPGPHDASTILDALFSPVSDANAQSCGTCEVPSSLQLKTADTDVNQLIGGQFLTPVAANGYAREAFAPGPAVVTDLIIAAGAPINREISIHLIAEGAICGGTLSDLDALTSLTVGESRSGLRIVVPAGSLLCAVASGTPTTHRLAMYWSGYKTY
jgi:hypothetical protein